MPYTDGETPVSIVRVDDRGLIDWRYRTDAVVGLEEAQQEVQIIAGIMKELGLEQSFLLIDIRRIKRIDREARQLFASREIHDSYGVQALSLLMGSPLSTFIGNFWFAINRPLHPTRLFSDEENARVWLETYIESD